MPRPLLIALIAFVPIPLMARADEPKQSPAVKRILEDTVRKVRTNRQAFDKANERPLAEARQELQALVAKLNKDGKTNEAIDTLKQVKMLEADVMRMANTPAPVGGGPGVWKKPLLERMVGKWTHPNSPIALVCLANGDCKQLDKNGAEHSAGRITPLSDSEAEIRENNGWSMRVRLIDDETMCQRLYTPDGTEDKEGRLRFRTK
jgi:hypothetical protein